MKAIVYHDSGSRDVLQCEEIEKPIPGDDEVLIKVRAASVNPADDHLLRYPIIRRILFALSKLRACNKTLPARGAAAIRPTWTARFERVLGRIGQHCATRWDLSGSPRYASR
jgi:hypothetical protein